MFLFALKLREFTNDASEPTLVFHDTEFNVKQQNLWFITDGRLQAGVIQLWVSKIINLA